MATMTFETQRGSDGRVRAGVWDRICVPGRDEKDGQRTEFTVDTLSQMVANFEERGDLIPIDHNHQSNYAATNGQPAPALGFYGALAVVEGGKVVKLGKAQGVEPSSSEGMDGRDGLWAFRSEVTPLGQELLPNFRLLSPTFIADGTRRDGTSCGYCLLAVAATNTPWQSQTKLSFEREAAEFENKWSESPRPFCDRCLKDVRARPELGGRDGKLYYVTHYLLRGELVYNETPRAEKCPNSRTIVPWREAKDWIPIKYLDEAIPYERGATTMANDKQGKRLSVGDAVLPPNGIEGTVDAIDESTGMVTVKTHYGSERYLCSTIEKLRRVGYERDATTMAAPGERVKCPKCNQRVKLGSDGKIEKHVAGYSGSIGSGDLRYSDCPGSGLDGSHLPSAPGYLANEEGITMATWQDIRNHFDDVLRSQGLHPIGPSSLTGNFVAVSLPSESEARSAERLLRRVPNITGVTVESWEHEEGKEWLVRATFDRVSRGEFSRFDANGLPPFSSKKTKPDHIVLCPDCRKWVGQFEGKFEQHDRDGTWTYPENGDCYRSGTPVPANTEQVWSRFASTDTDGTADGSTKGDATMNPKQKLAAFMGARFGLKFEAEPDDKKLGESASKCLEGEALKAATQPRYDYSAGADDLEEMARLYEESNVEPDGDEEKPQETMRRMAVKFRKMAAVDGQDAAAPPELAAFARSLGLESRGKTAEQIMDGLRAVAVPASKVAEAAKLAAQSAIAEDREQRAAAERKARAAQLMEQLPKSYPGDRESLRRLAERDPDEAAKLAAPFMAPGHLFDRFTANGSPIGKMSREEASMTPSKTYRTPFGQFVVEDDAFAAEIERVAFSQDPVMMSRVDALVRPHERQQKAARLIAAEKLVRRERPELAAGE